MKTTGLVIVSLVTARALRVMRSNSAMLAGATCSALLFAFVQGCARQAAPQHVTLTLLEEWTSPWMAEGRRQEIEQFTRATGIGVRLLPSPEAVREKLALWQDALAGGAGGPDVYGIDVIWPRTLSQYLIDLRPYFAKEIPLQFPAMSATYTVDDKVVAVPYRADIGLLYYRADLLRQYGFRRPPQSWDELEVMAARIQAGERAKGKKDFWGYVWQGAASEALTCDALEWQAATGGGHIIEDDSTISVNNPGAIRAWQRAAAWVGSISPPSIVAYTEWDALNVWIAGDAAFMRNWPTSYYPSVAAESPIRDKFAVALLPGGKAGQVGTQGGGGVAVSRFSAHPKEAIALARYLSSEDVQLKRSRTLLLPPTLMGLYDRSDFIATNPYLSQLNHAFRAGMVSRPSNVTGTKYEQVAEAYIRAVHSVLTHTKSAPDAAAALESELIRITGFRTGPPK